MEGIIEKLNTMRTNPMAIKSNCMTVAKALKRVKKPKSAEELEAFCGTLDTLQPIQGLKNSKGLNRFCEQELKKVVGSGKEIATKNLDQLKKDALKYVKGFHKLFMAYDKGGLDFLVARIIVSEYDPERVNKHHILSSDYNYIGVATMQDEEEDDHTVLIFADQAEDIDDDFNYEDYRELKKAFDSFDVNKTELLNAKELLHALKQLDFDTDNPVVFEIIKNLDTQENNEHGVDFRTFCLTFDKSLSDSKSKVGLERLFKLFVDDPHANSITDVTIKKLCANLGINLQEGEARQIIERAAVDGREITFDEFYTIMTSHPHEKK